MTKKDLQELVRLAIAKTLEEENVTSGGEAYNTKFAFSKGGKNMATKYAEKLGYKLVGKQPKSGKTYEFVKYESKSPVNEGEGKSLQDLEMGEKFTFDGEEFTFIELYPENPDSARVILPDGRKSVVSFGGGRVNTGKVTKYGPHSFGQGKGHHIDENTLNETSYRSFNKSISEMKPERKMYNAVKSINKRLREIDQLVDYSLRLQEENGLTNENQLSSSLKGLEKISEMMNGLTKKIKKLKK